MSGADWDAFWLGLPPRRLYAALHGAPGATGVVLAPPLLHELPRSRRFLTEIAGEFAAMGLPCLRFDYHGTGDSGGEGEELDFASMQRDLDLAVQALRDRTGVERTVLLAWRGSALALQGWVERAAVDLVVLWEPILDGAQWLRELVEGDAAERAQRPPPRAGVPRTTNPADGQLMGFAASPRLRGDLDRARVEGDIARGRVPVWGVVRASATALPLALARKLALPEGAPNFNVAAAMDATFFLTPPMRDLVGELGVAMRREAFA